MHIVSVALPIPIAQTFDYIIPDNFFPAVGGRVIVPFGTNKKIGIVIAIKEHSTINLKKIKFLKDVLDTSSLFSNSLWRLLIWSIDYYHYPVGKVLFNALPAYLRKGKKADIVTFQWFTTKKVLSTSINKLSIAPKQQKALSILLRGPIYSYQVRELHLKETTLQALRTKGLCDIRIIPNNKKLDWRIKFSVNYENIKLNKEQAIAVSYIIKNDEKFITWLLAGVTGSGKTEIYLTVLEKILSKGKQALVLVPEISLTPQTIDRFRKRFIAPVDVLHSGLNNSERLEVWLKARCGDSAIIIGTRSAIFTPFAFLGIIIIDEEHDSSYKQHCGWCYHARDLAVFRAREENIPIILGTATPTLETLYNVQKKKYKQITLSNRAGSASKYSKKLLDMKGKRLTNGLLSILLKKIRKHLEDDNQVMLFINRRGFAPVLLCHECGWIAECKQCDHYYTLHKDNSNMQCHYCENKFSIPYQCLKCGSTQLLPVGLGTEQLESTLSKTFPNFPVTRIDSDTTSCKGLLENDIFKVNSCGARIFIGTKMLSKVHNFPYVTLVALLDVDCALFSGDFRAAERFAQLYTQVSGSAGRYGKHNEVLLQTYHAEHPLLQSLLNKTYIELAKQMLEERRQAQLPPFTSNIIFRAEDDDNNKAMIFLNELIKLLCLNPLFEENILIIGPIQSLTPKRCGNFRWQIILSNPSKFKLNKLVSTTLNKVITINKKHKVKWSIDVDPLEV